MCNLAERKSCPGIKGDPYGCFSAVFAKQGRTEGEDITVLKN